MTPSDVLRHARAHGLRGVTCNDAGEYTCHECGNRWRARERYVWWPIRVRWVRSDAYKYRFVSHHGWHVAFDGIEQRVYGHTFRVWRIALVFGPVDR